MRLRRAVATATVAAAVLVTSFVGSVCGCNTPSFGGGGGGCSFGVTTANVWSEPDNTINGTCTRNATPETLAAAEAALRVCNPNDYAGGSIAGAYVAANTGDTIGMAGGSYASQEVAGADAKAAGGSCNPFAAGSSYAAGTYPQLVSDYTDCIMVEPKQGASVSISGWIGDVPYLYLKGGSQRFGADSAVTITASTELGSVDSCSTSNNIVVEGINSKHGVFLRGTSVALLNSDINYGDAYPVDPTSQINGTCGHDKILVKGTIFQNLDQWQKSDQTGSSGDNQMHMECMHVNLGSNIVFDSNKFINCAEFSISAQASPSISNLKIVQNVFGEICQDQTPVGVQIASGTFTNGSNVVTSVSDTSGVNVGDGVYSIYLPYTNNYLSPPTVPTVVSKTSNSLTLTANAIGSQTSIFTAGGAACTGQRALQVYNSTSTSDVLIAFNSFYNERNAFDGTVSGTNESYGNIRVALTSFFCDPAAGSSYLANATDWPASDPTPDLCGSGSAMGAVNYVNAANYDFRLGATSVARDLVPASFSDGVPSVDILGNTRTGTNYDAGAYDSSATTP